MGQGPGAATIVAGLAVGALLAPGPAYAQNALAVDEVKAAVLAHDVGFAGGKEGGADINGEVLFRSPIDDRTASAVPSYLRWIVQPRLNVGFEANTSGFTSQVYFGGNWTWILARQLFSPGDAVNFGISFGPSFNDGKIRTSAPDRKSLGSHALFRVAFELGYQFFERYEVSLFFDHESDAGLARENQSINDAGLRFGFKF
jgi:lipid A 3-O-deacylase